MAQKSKFESPSINLAKNLGKTFWDQFLSWAVTIGRLVIILTETLALGAFLFRFSLDRQLVDIHDKITEEQAIVSLLGNNEKTYRSLQDRLSNIKKIDGSTQTQVKTFKDILSFVPADMTVRSFTYSTSGIQIDGSVDSVVSLSDFVNKIKNYPGVKDVSINKLQNQSSTSMLLITISITLKNI